MRDAIEQETRAFREKHEIPVETRERTACLEDLIDIRANERRRILADLRFI
jgi:hypothetical protein